MASAWASLTDQQRASMEAQGYNKKSYNKEYGAKGGNKGRVNVELEASVNRGKAKQAAGDYQDQKYSEIDDQDYKNAVDKSTHKQDRKDAGTYTNDKMKERANNSRGSKGPGRHATEGLSDYSQLSKEEKKNTNKKDYNRRTKDGSPSKWDIKKEYARNDASLEDYQALQDGGTVTDAAAQAYLAKKIKQLTPDTIVDTPVDPVPDEPITPTPDPDPVTPAPTPGPTPTPTPTPAPGPTPTPVPTDPYDPYEPPISTGPIDQELDQTIDQDVDNSIDDSFNGGTIGDIDMTTTIKGDGNTVNNTVDNSNNSRYYGGDNRVFAINYGEQNASTGSGNGFALGGSVRTPASDLTMLGAYGVNDTPASQASFVDMYSDLNALNQQKYKNAGADITSKYMKMGNAANPSSWDSINAQLSNSINQAYQNAADLEFKMGGDWRNYNVPKYQFPDPLKPVDDSGIEDAEEDARNGING